MLYEVITPLAAESGREQAGEQGCDQAVEISDPGAEADQGEHVEMAADQRLPAADEEWPAPTAPAAGQTATAGVLWSLQYDEMLAVRAKIWAKMPRSNPFCLQVI